ncbi:hypothetical protein SLS53_009318 [Cytospora paraplurivora]|uniref:Uncharacterized protein n=1 Tax=Cytospora paraplurivora TaxID=2898453 RepID=A0AAN9TWT3_9PEZI
MSGKTHLLRIINGGSAGLQYYSVDEHNMTVISNDFIPIKPYTAKFITLGVGQRADVLVQGKSGVDANRAYWMRGNLSTVCALPRQPYALAAIYYSQKDSKANSLPSSTAQNFDPIPLNCGNDPLTLTQPLSAQPAAQEPSLTVTIDVTYAINETGQQEWRMNGQAFRANYNHPILELAHERNYTYPYDPEWNVINTGQSKVVRVIWNNERNKSESFAHPIHLHGHDFQVLAQGIGEWDGVITNPQNPLRRDTQILQPLGYLVMQFETDNPGIWPLHCHVAWHLSTGFYVNIMERPEDLVQKQIPNIVEQTCKAWTAWTNRNVVDQIDSGLRKE